MSHLKQSTYRVQTFQQAVYQLNGVLGFNGDKRDGKEKRKKKL